MNIEKIKHNIGKREIEFRAWSKKNNRMLHNVSTGTIHIFDKKMEELHTDCVFMKYTGLKDKNGNRIFDLDYIDNHFLIYFDEFKISLVNIFTGDIIDAESYFHNNENKKEITGNYFEVYEDSKGGIDKYF